MNDPAFEALFRPQAVAVVGASSDPSRIGGKPIRYYRENRFSGALYPINPNRSEVQGYKAFPSVAEIPGAIDFALLAVPAAQVVGALEECARKGAKAAVVFSAGFAEIGGDGPALQQQLVAAAKASGVRLIGPNCLGVFNAAHGHYATFSSFLEKGAPPPGRVAIVSQSGAYGTHLLVLGTRRGLGTNYWVTTGNEADLSVADCIDFLAGDDGTDVICSYVEGVKDGARFIAALEKARRAKKPVILMKVGRSATGALAAASHTASLAGSDEVFDAVLRQYGAERAETTEQLIDFAYAATRMKFPRSRRLGLLTISGGAGVLMADAAERAGLDVAAMPEDSQKKLLAMNPFAGVRNPVDVTAQAINDFSLLRRYLETMLDEGGYETVCGFFTWWPEAPGLGEKLRQTLAEALQGREDRLLFLAVTGPAEILARYEALGFLVYEDASRAVAAIGALARFGERFAATPDAAPSAPAGALPPPGGTVDEHEAKRILASAGVPMLEERLARSADEAASAAEEMGGAVALKIVSPDILHKTEIGGVLLGLSGAAVREGYERIVASARRAKPDAAIAGVLVSPMAGDGVEAIVGMRNDPVFGPVMVLGLGGIFVEVLRDTALRVGAVSVAEARRMIDELRGRALFAGVRGRGPADVAALAQAISRLSAWAAAHASELDSVEINPLLVREERKGAVALDALIVPRPVAGPAAI